MPKRKGSNRPKSGSATALTSRKSGNALRFAADLVRLVDGMEVDLLHSKVAHYDVLWNDAFRSYLSNPFNSDGTLNEKNRYRYVKRQTEILTDVFRTCKDFMRSQGIGGDHASRLADISVAAERTRMIEQTLAKNIQTSAGPSQPTRKKEEPDDPFVTNEALRSILSSFLEKCEKDEVTPK